MNDLYLEYLFTDRGGRAVYSMREVNEANRIVGQMRMGVFDEFPAVEWKEPEIPFDEPDVIVTGKLSY